MFELAATIVFLFLSVTWKSRDWINLIFKLAITAMMFWGAFETLKAFGYIVKMS